MSFENNTFKSITHCQNSTLVFYQHQIRSQRHVLTLAKKVLPQSLADRISQCVISKKKLILYIDSSEYLSQLTLYQPQILQGIADLIALESVEVCILCETVTASKSKRAVKRPSEQTIHEIRRNALSGTEEDVLSRSLLRLSQTLERLS